MGIRSALLHHCIDLLDRFRELVSYIDEPLHGHSLLTSGQDQQDLPAHHLNAALDRPGVDRWGH